MDKQAGDRCHVGTTLRRYPPTKHFFHNFVSTDLKLGTHARGAKVEPLKFLNKLFFWLILARWCKTCFFMVNNGDFQFLSPPTVFKRQLPTCAGVHLNIMWTKLRLKIFHFFTHFFIKIFEKMFLGRVRKTPFFRIFCPRKKFLDKKSEMFNRNFIPKGLVKFGAQFQACSIKTEGGDTIWK